MTTTGKIPTTKDYFFIYGSLRKGEYNHYFIKKDSKFISYAILSGYKLVSFGSYPAIVTSSDETDVVVGELLQITDQEKIDKIEGMELDACYKRELKKVKLEDGSEQEAFFYSYKKERLSEKPTFIESGDWAKRDRK